MSKKYIVTVPDDFLLPPLTDGYGRYLSVEPYEGDKYKHALDILCGMSVRSYNRVFGANLSTLGLDTDEIVELLFVFEETAKQVKGKVDDIVNEIGIGELYEYVKGRYDNGEG